MKRTLISTNTAWGILAIWLLAGLPANAQQPGDSVASVRAPQGWEEISPTLRANRILASEMEALDFRNTPLQDVVRAIAETARLNILFDPSILEGTVTLHLEKVRLGTALEEILRTRGLTLIVNDRENIVRIVRATMAGQTGVETVQDIVFLKYLDARRAADNLREVFKPQDAQRSRVTGGGARPAVQETSFEGGPPYPGEMPVATRSQADQISIQERLVGITYHRESNSVILTAPPLVMAKMKDILATLDKPGNEVAETKTQVVRVNWLDAVTLAKDLTNLFGESQEKSDDESMDVRVRVRGVEESLVRIVPQTATNSVMVTAPSPYFEDILAVIDELDIPQKQVQIQARLVDMQVRAVRDMGTNFALWRTDSSGASPITVGGTPSDLLGTAMPLAAAANGLNLGIGDNLAIFGKDYNLSFELRALEERRVVEILANPKVMVVNKQRADIDIIQSIPYFTTSFPEGGAAPQQTVNFERAGILLSVIPTITENDQVRVNMQIEQRVQVGSIAGQGLSPVPIIDSRRTNTDVVVRTGETIMTGGLRQMNFSDITTGVPWFHQIPVLGWLFKTKNNEQDKRELFLFLTPNVMTDVTLTEEGRAQYDRLDHKWYLPDYFFDDVKTREDMD